MYRDKAKNSGFSLIEVLVAIVILAAAVAPILTSLVLSSRANAKSDELLHTQLAVQSVVEQLMAEGFMDYTIFNPENRNGTLESKNFPGNIVEFSSHEDAQDYHPWDLISKTITIKLGEYDNGIKVFAYPCVASTDESVIASHGVQSVDNLYNVIVTDGEIESVDYKDGKVTITNDTVTVSTKISSSDTRASAADTGEGNTDG